MHRPQSQRTEREIRRWDEGSKPCGCWTERPPGLDDRVGGRPTFLRFSHAASAPLP